jgi:hypothetical protein
VAIEASGHIVCGAASSIDRQTATGTAVDHSAKLYVAPLELLLTMSEQQPPTVTLPKLKGPVPVQVTVCVDDA